MAKKLFSAKEELVTIALYYKTKTNKYNISQYKVLDEETAKEALSKGDKNVDAIITKWSIPTWKSNSVLLRSSTFYNPTDGSNKIDWSKYEENIFRNCLKEWDVVDENGNPIPVNIDTIGMLPPTIATALLALYDKVISLEDEDTKK